MATAGRSLMHCKTCIPVGRTGQFLHTRIEWSFRQREATRMEIEKGTGWFSGCS